MNADDAADQQPEPHPPRATVKAGRARKRFGSTAVAAWTSLGVGLLLVAFAGVAYTDASSRTSSLQSKLDSYSRKMNSLEADLREASEASEATQHRVTILEGQSISVTAVYDKVIDSVVTVYCGSALGSGFAWDAAPGSGYDSVVITNNHVIEDCRGSEDARHIRLVKYDGTSMAAYVWTWDEKNDLALLMVHGKLPPLEEAPLAQKGDPVIAVGSPQGLAGSVTRGIISNLYSDVYQTDAAINHGNSGGPLLNKDGQVLGVTTLALDREGLNIAVRTAQFCAAILNC